MVNEKDKDEFFSRVKALRLNPDALEEVVIHVPGSNKFVIKNIPGKINSLQIWANATSNDGYVSQNGARRALEIFGDAYRAEAKKAREEISDASRHPAIDYLENLVASGKSWRVDVIRRESAKQIPAHVVSAIKEIRKDNPTPFYVYDATGIRETIQTFNKAFNWVPGGFKNYFAVKALPNPHILRLMKQQEWGADCSSLPEIRLAMSVTSNMKGNEIMFTSNDTPESEFQEAYLAGAILNLDDITHIDRVQEALREDSLR
jgi:hypothetical protein